MSLSRCCQRRGKRYLCVGHVSVSLSSQTTTAFIFARGPLGFYLNMTWHQCSIKTKAIYSPFQTSVCSGRAGYRTPYEPPGVAITEARLCRASSCLRKLLSRRQQCTAQPCSGNPPANAAASLRRAAPLAVVGMPQGSHQGRAVATFLLGYPAATFAALRSVPSPAAAPFRDLRHGRKATATIRVAVD